MMLLVGLHVRRQGSGRVVASRARCALVRLLRVVRLHVNLQMIAESGKYVMETRSNEDDRNSQHNQIDDPIINSIT